MPNFFWQYFWFCFHESTAKKMGICMGANRTNRGTVDTVDNLTFFPIQMMDNSLRVFFVCCMYNRQTLDRQTLDTTNPGQNRTGGMHILHTWHCKLRFCVHNLADFSIVLLIYSTSLLNVHS
jgi:hypothetical protein